MGLLEPWEDVPAETWAEVSTSAANEERVEAYSSTATG